MFNTPTQDGTLLLLLFFSSQKNYSTSKHSQDRCHLNLPFLDEQQEVNKPGTNIYISFVLAPSLNSRGMSGRVSMSQVDNIWGEFQGNKMKLRRRGRPG